MLPLVSVIVPVYNTEKYLKECIDSIVNQTLTNIEIILINDGSTDGSLKILQEYAEKDSRIIIIDQENKGLGETRNVGIKLASAPYLAFVDSDDFISPSMMEKLYFKILKDKSDMIKCAFTRVLQDGSSTQENSMPINVDKEEFFKAVLSVDYFSIFPNGLYKRELFVKNNLFFKNMLFEDAELLFKTIYHSQDISYIDEVFYFWRKTNNSITRSIGRKQIDDVFKMTELTYGFLKENNLYKKYKTEFIQRCLYFYHGLVDKTLNYGVESEKDHIEYISKKISTNIFLNKESLGIIKENHCVSYIMKKSYLYLSNNSDNFTKFTKYFCKNIYNLSNKNESFILYGNGTVSKVIQNIIPNQIIGYVDMSDVNHHPETLKDISFDKIIITVLGREHNITKYLVNELKIDKDKILTLPNIINCDSKMYEEAKKFMF